VLQLQTARPHFFTADHAFGKASRASRPSLALPLEQQAHRQRHPPIAVGRDDRAQNLLCDHAVMMLAEQILQALHALDESRGRLATHSLRQLGA
jgi:hypothetical protein